MNAKTRETIYYLGTIIVGGVGLAVTVGALTADQGSNIGQIVTGLLTLLGAGAPALAARKTGEQRKGGVFDNPVGTAFDQLGTIKSQVDVTVEQAQAKVAEAVAVIQGATATLPGAAAITNAVTAALPPEVAALIEGVTNQRRDSSD
ncbi:hypothetical protein H7I53_17810 [Mycolicibacterium pulveris]|uniref:Holin n=1 Tax=Mycolicibacterium pulveris TaxID=36813 RepID=A0A7I7UFE2_MYCPV|nr:hypothetical protein [Mycolicibacterium pulveris]MCV6982074.1 hypothetical protein [Mycolicibacterium pulveris]BBY78886.1 hypothetical protein MPUL_00440 [Mycolicibacterium pulveris]